MIDIKNLTRFSIDEEFLKRVAKKILRKEKKEGELSIVFIRLKEMKNLNRKFRRKNMVTDVLAFSQIPEFKFSKDLGEIVICPKVVKKNATRFTTDFKEELTRALIHGILHLIGYEHKKYEEARGIKKKEDYYLKIFF